MKIVCGSVVLKEALQNVQRAIASKSTIEVLEGVLLRARSRNELFVCGYNLEMGITTVIPAKVDEPSGLVLDAKLLIDILRKTSSDAIEIDLNDNLDVLVASGESKFSIKALSQEDYPVLPSVNEGKKIELPSDVLKKMIKQTVFAASVLDDRPVNMGTLFKIKDHVLTLVSLDGFRLAKTCSELSVNNSLDGQFIVPAKTLSELVRLMPGEKVSETEQDDGRTNVGGIQVREKREEDVQNDLKSGSISIFVGDHHVVFNVFGYSVITRLLEGTFLDYDAAIPKTCDFSLKLSTQDLISSIERVSVLISERTKSPVRLKFSEGVINFYCRSPLGESEDRIVADFSGDEFEIGLNSKYILDALKSADTDIVNVEFSGALAPVKITPISGDSFLFLVLPVRLVAG